MLLPRKSNLCIKFRWDAVGRCIELCRGSDDALRFCLSWKKEQQRKSYLEVRNKTKAFESFVAIKSVMY